METISLINLMPKGKEQVNSFVQKTVESVMDGNANPLELSIKLKYIEKSISEIQSQIKDLATTEAEKYGKSFEMQGVKIDIAQVGVKYDFSGCNDLEWNELDKKEKELKKIKSEREKFLKGIKGKLTELNEDTGEVNTILEPCKSGKESIKITLL